MKKLQLTDKRNMLGRVMGWLLLFSLIMTVVPQAGAAGSVDTLAGIVSGLGDAAFYGAVTNNFIQKGHSETSILADKITKTVADPFMTSIRGQKVAPKFTLVADINIYGEHDAIDSLTFALFESSGTGYSQVAAIDPVTVTGIPASTDPDGVYPVTGVEFEITDPSLYTDGLFVFQIDSGDMVKNNNLNTDGLIVHYGDEATGDPLPVMMAPTTTYIGSISLEGGMANSSTVKILQEKGDYYSSGNEVQFGEGLYLYEKTASGDYVKITADTDHDVSAVYIHQTAESEGGEWTDSNPYKLFQPVTAANETNVKWKYEDGKGHWTYYDEPVSFVFVANKSSASTLSSCSDLSKALIHDGGTWAQGAALADSTTGEGNGTVHGTKDANGNVVTFYTATCSNTAEAWSGNYPINWNSMGYPWWTNDGIPISDNEYIVVNVVCPQNETISSGNDDIALKTPNGKIIPGNWTTGGDVDAYSRVIWNFISEAPGGGYEPFRGTINYNGSLGGLILAPEADIVLNRVGNASTFVADTIQNNGVELHQLLFGGDAEKTFDIEMKPITADLVLSGSKTLTGRDVTATDIFTFTVKDELGETVTTGQSDPTDNGNIVFDKIVYKTSDVGSHTYTVMEDSTTISGVTVDSTPRTVTVVVAFDTTTNELTATVDSSSSDALEFVNEYASTGAIELTKVDAVNSSRKLSGAVFSVYSDNACATKVQDMPETDTDGYSKLEDLPAGTYYLKETTAPAGYALSNTVYTVTVTAGETFTVDGDPSTTDSDDPIKNTELTAEAALKTKKNA